jgi:hypothetical protein
MSAIEARVIMLFRQELMRREITLRVGVAMVRMVVQVFCTMLHCSLARVVCSSHSLLFLSFAFVRSFALGRRRAREDRMFVESSNNLSVKILSSGLVGSRCAR